MGLGQGFKYAAGVLGTPGASLRDMLLVGALMVVWRLIEPSFYDL